MKKPLLFVALALGLLISACSQTPLEQIEGGLEPQFGTADEDYGIDVAFASTGRIYVLSQQDGPVYEEYEDGTSYENGIYSDILLKRYDGSGNLIWSTRVAGDYCYWDWYDCDWSVEPKSIYTDSRGYVYVLNTSESYSENYHHTFITHTVNKYDASGSYISSAEVGSDGGEPGSVPTSGIDVVVDSVGNIYAAGTKHTFNGYTETGSTTHVVSKYATNGALLWQRTSTVGIPKGITVSSTGNVFVVGSTGVARYTSSGNLTWTKSGGGDDIIISGSNLYVRAKTTIRKLDGNGKQLWSKAQSGLSGMVIADMVGDGSGNVYLTGKFNKTSTNRDAFARKLNSSGSVLWTQQFGTGAYDDARGIATINGSEIYVTGETQGSLSHTNIGGSDGYLRKMNSSGSRLWTR